MKPYFVKTPSLIQKVFKNQIWSLSTKNKEIYLTFDDGPTPEITPWVLNTLQQYSALATFFCIGKNIEEHPTIFQQIIDKGHAIGNHTYKHLNGWKTTNDEYLDSVLKTEKTIQKFKLETRNPKLFRPPYGKIKKLQAKALIKNSYNIIMWTVLSADFDTTINEEKCLNNVIENAKNGTIIVFHDSIKAFDKLQIVLPKVLAFYSKKGYTFKKIENEPF